MSRSNGSSSRLAGLSIGAGELPQIVERCMRSVELRATQERFACANPHSLAIAERDPEFRHALGESSILVADGVGLTHIGSLAGRDFGPRITGFDFFTALMTALDRRSGSVFFFGSTTATLAAIRDRCGIQYPRVRVCGAISPPFTEWSEEVDAQFVAQINAAKPDVLWVGMTAPRQEKWVRAAAARLDVPVIGSIGAVFDFFAGTKKRAPRWVCRAGMEWAYRLALEPRRLWKRTLLSAPLFLWIALREALHARETTPVREGATRL